MFFGEFLLQGNLLVLLNSFNTYLTCRTIE